MHKCNQSDVIKDNNTDCSYFSGGKSIRSYQKRCTEKEQ